MNHIPRQNPHPLQVAFRNCAHQKFELSALHQANQCTDDDQYVQHEQTQDLIHLAYLWHR